jgi:arylsulfatase
VRVPFLAKFPKGMNDLSNGEILSNGHMEADSNGLHLAIDNGSITNTFSTVMDLAPTILQMAGVKHPAPTYQGREVVHMRGKSMLPFLAGSASSVHPADHITGWETCGRAAVRCGDWKIVFIPKPKGPEKWQLYNLAKDPGEVHDLAEKDPERLQRMIKMWDQYVLETGVIPLAPALGNWIEAMEEQMPEDAWMEYEYWKDGARENPEAFRREIPKFTRTVKAM